MIKFFFSMIKFLTRDFCLACPKAIQQTFFSFVNLTEYSRVVTMHTEILSCRAISST
ncbi:unnamed protein product [Brassica oleracea]